MSENNTVKTSTISTSIPAEISDSGEIPPTPVTAAGEKTEKEDVDTVRESKRRKNCPTALEKIEEITPSNRWFSFSFDTKLSGSTPEFTPKFGSFNLGRESGAAAAEEGCCQIPARKEAAEEDEVAEVREAVVALSSVD